VVSCADPTISRPLLCVQPQRKRRSPSPQRATHREALPSRAWWAEPARRSPRWRKCVCDQVSRDLSAHGLAALQRILEADAALDTGILVLVGHLYKVLVVSFHVRVAEAGRREGDDQIEPKHRFRYADHDAGADGRLPLDRSPEKG
jgi:hypothetical protein